MSHIATAVALGLGLTFIVYANRNAILNFFMSLAPPQPSLPSENPTERRLSTQSSPQCNREFKQENCPICLFVMEFFESLQLPCSHWFHKNCLKIFFSSAVRGRTCPVCRAEVPHDIIKIHTGQV